MKPVSGGTDQVLTAFTFSLAKVWTVMLDHHRLGCGPDSVFCLLCLSARTSASRFRLGLGSGNHQKMAGWSPKVAAWTLTCANNLNYHPHHRLITFSFMLHHFYIMSLLCHLNFCSFYSCFFFYFM